MVKAFFFGTIKLTIALLLIALAIGCLFWGWNTVTENRQKAQDAPLSEPKKWPSIKIEAMENLTINLLTKWHDGTLYYQFSTDGYPKAVETARSLRQGESRKLGFTIDFIDSSGFKVFSHDVALRDMAEVVNADGRAHAVNANSQARMTAQEYRAASRWEIGWNFVTTVDQPRPAPKEIPHAVRPKQDKPKWQNVALWRQLDRQMSKEQVQQLLGAPTKIDDGGALVFWYYGYPLGGRVTFRSAGGIYGWREP